MDAFQSDLFAFLGGSAVAQTTRSFTFVFTAGGKLQWHVDRDTFLVGVMGESHLALTMNAGYANWSAISSAPGSYNDVIAMGPSSAPIAIGTFRHPLKSGDILYILTNGANNITIIVSP